MTLVTIYRPPSAQRSNSSAMFFREFSTLLESINLCVGRLIICGDFNFHVDDLSNPEARTFSDILEAAGLRQLVHEATHTHGHTLDLVIVKDNDEAVTDITVLNSAPSDHAAVIFNVMFPKPCAEKKKVTTRSLHSDYMSFRSSTVEKFAEATDLDKLDVDAKVDLYNDSLSTTLDQHAPAREKEVQLRPHAPWYDNALRTSKRNVRRLERRWRKSKIPDQRRIMRT